MFAMIDGTRIFYETAGQGPPIVFVHGLGGTSNIWHAQRVVLSRLFQIVTVDLPGSGRSDRTSASYSMERWCDQIAGLAQQIGLEKFVLVGHSMTTLLAQKIAAKYPDRIIGLVLCGPITELPPAGKEAFQKRAEVVRKEGMSVIADAVLAGGITAAGREGADAALAGLWREVLLSNDPASYASQCLALVNGSAKADQSNIRCPTLILVGDQDAVTPLANARAIAAAVPTACIRIVPATAHMTMLERPEAFNAELLEFLAGLPAGNV